MMSMDTLEQTEEGKNYESLPFGSRALRLAKPQTG